MNSKTLRVDISKDNIVSQLSALLYATGVVADNYEVLDIRFYVPTNHVGPLKPSDVVTLEVDVKKEGVKLPRRNGTKKEKLP